MELCVLFRVLLSALHYSVIVFGVFAASFPAIHETLQGGATCLAIADLSYLESQCN